MKKNVILKIDTSSLSQTVVALDIDGHLNVISQEGKILKSQILLPLIEQMLKKNKVDLSDIKEIKVKLEGESSTGIRVGLAVANTLGWLLHIPVNGKVEQKLKQQNY